MKLKKLALPYRDVALVIVGALIGIGGTALTNYLSASRSERFQLEMQRRAEIKVALSGIQLALAAVEAKDERALEAALERVKISSLHLPDYRSMAMPLLLAVQSKSIEENHYRI